jgi:hypothetical protein
MTPRWTIALATLGFGLLSGCTILQSNSQPSQSSAAETPASSSSAPSAVNPAVTPPNSRPDTRIMPMAVEGTLVEMELSLFNKSSLPFTTYVPTKDFETEVDESSQGTVAQFFFSPKGKKDQTAYVQIFLPARQTSVEEMRRLLLDESGLLASNRWSLVDRTNIVSYTWASEKLIYQQKTGKQNFVGSIYIGEYKGQAFYALTHYPAEYTDGFEPRSTVMLENLQFRDEPL